MPGHHVLTPTGIRRHSGGEQTCAQTEESFRSHPVEPASGWSNPTASSKLVLTPHSPSSPLGSFTNENQVSAGSNTALLAESDRGRLHLMRYALQVQAI